LYFDETKTVTVLSTVSAMITVTMVTCDNGRELGGYAQFHYSLHRSIAIHSP